MHMPPPMHDTMNHSGCATPRIQTIPLNAGAWPAACKRLRCVMRLFRLCCVQLATGAAFLAASAALMMLPLDRTPTRVPFSSTTGSLWIFLLSRILQGGVEWSRCV